MQLCKKRSMIFTDVMVCVCELVVRNSKTRKAGTVRFLGTSLT